MVGRAAALLVLGVALGLYYSFHERLWEAPTWWDIAFMALVLIPACFALVWLVLPLRDRRGLLLAAIAFGGWATAFHFADWNTPENFCKLFALTALGFWFLRWFESLSLVVLIAAVIPLVDSYSVFSPRGPTNLIVTEHEHVFTDYLSFTFPVPGEPGSANLGLPDLLFFALFLAAAARFALRPRLTWILLTLSFGATLALAAAWRGGLPALPLLSIGFLAANADLIWQRLRPKGRERHSVETGRRSSGHSDA
jgi:uncharacterized membrane protein YjjB (DUF3815 family)